MNEIKQLLWWLNKSSMGISYNQMSILETLVRNLNTIDQDYLIEWSFKEACHLPEHLYKELEAR